AGKVKTLKRLFAYLLSYKKQIFIVLLFMAFGVIVSLLNPLFIEKAIDTYIAAGNMPGLIRLLLLALILNLLMVGSMKLRMLMMEKRFIIVLFLNRK
ncbi:hypothetical protein IKJ53_00870, partial [bacterium]|nr:hypothetical protein [bacterium]